MTRFATFTTPSNGLSRVGVVDGDILRCARHGTTMLDLLEEGLAEAGERIKRSDEVYELSGVRLEAPVSRPPSVRDFMAFEQHVRAGFGFMGWDVPEQFYRLPVFYFTNPRAIVGPHDDVPVPPGSERFDFELEIAAIVGREGSDLDPAQAGSHIAGYSIFVDWSARDLQADEMKMNLGPAKGKDTASTLGPFLVTPDEIADRRNGRGFDLEMTVSVNGHPVGSDNWSNIHWSFEEMLSYASRGTRLSVGDVVGSGTCGMGCLIEIRSVDTERDHPWLAPGDVVRVDVDGLGTTENRVVAGVPVIEHRLADGT